MGSERWVQILTLRLTGVKPWDKLPNYPDFLELSCKRGLMGAPTSVSLVR